MSTKPPAKRTRIDASSVITVHDALETEFAKAALQGLLMDPNVNPRNTLALNTAVDFCWHIARTMVERRPPPKGKP